MASFINRNLSNLVIYKVQLIHDPSDKERLKFKSKGTLVYKHIYYKVATLK